MATSCWFAALVLLGTADTGYGDTQPAASNASKAGRQLNRRTEFKVTGK